MLLSAAAVLILLSASRAFCFNSMLYAGLRSSSMRRGAAWLRRTSFVRGVSSDIHPVPTDTEFPRFEVDPTVLVHTLKQFGTDMREKSDGCLQLKECKLCKKGNRLKPDNIWKLNVWPSGSFHCFRCSSKGNWYDLQESARSYVEGAGASAVDTNVTVYPAPGGVKKGAAYTGVSTEPYIIPAQYIANRPHYNLFPTSQRLQKDSIEDKLDRAEVKKHLNDVRGLTDATLLKYNVGFAYQEFLNDENKWEEELCVTFPWIMPRQSLEGMNLDFKSAGDSEGTEDLVVRLKYR
jgi:hypothetical protein